MCFKRYPDITVTITTPANAMPQNVPINQTISILFPIAIDSPLLIVQISP